MMVPWDQMFPPTPRFTLEEIPNLTSKVFIVTGGSSGIGFELVKLLYQKQGTVYIATRSSGKALQAIKTIKAAFPTSAGRLEFLFVDLADLGGIMGAAKAFLSRERRLDVLWNNAGVFVPPIGSKTKQGHELQLGTNCLGPFLFTQGLLPLLKRTADASPTNSVRVIWTGSLAIDMARETGGMNLHNLACDAGQSQMSYYVQSKCGNLFLGSELAKRMQGEGVLSLTINPGNVKSSMQRYMPGWQRFLCRLVAYDAIYGAFTEAFAGLSCDITEKQNGGYFVPWGRPADVRPDILLSLIAPEEGGNGKAKAFWEFCEKSTNQYL